MVREKSDGINVLKQSDLKDHISIKRLDVDSNMFLVELRNKFLIVKRIGKCDYKKCKNACCKFISLSYPHSYFEGFGKVNNQKTNVIIKKTCKFLCKTGTCNRWGKKDFPEACKQFPHVSDGTFIEIMDRCTFKYEIIYEIEKFGNNIREEMILGFKEYVGPETS